jgi:hypothetical protein
MKHSEMQLVAVRLAELAEFYDRKPPTANALKVWADAFTGCTLVDVMDVLTDWPRTKRAFPIACEVVECCRELNAERHAALSRRRDEPIPEFKPSDPNSPAYARFKTWFAEFKRNPPYCPYPDHIGTFVRVGAVLAGSLDHLQTNPDEWWQSILKRHADGDKTLTHAQVEFARRASVNAGGDGLSESEREAREERAAIQSEGM